MIKNVYAVYDTVADYYDSPMVFDNEQFAIAAIRRNCRNMYLRKEVTYDELRDRQFVHIGYYDTHLGELESYFEEDYEVTRINLASFVGDLVGDTTDEI